MVQHVDARGAASLWLGTATPFHTAVYVRIVGPSSMIRTWCMYVRVRGVLTCTCAYYDIDASGALMWCGHVCSPRVCVFVCVCCVRQSQCCTFAYA